MGDALFADATMPMQARSLSSLSLVFGNEQVHSSYIKGRTAAQRGTIPAFVWESEKCGRS